MVALNGNRNRFALSEAVRNQPYLVDSKWMQAALIDTRTPTETRRVIKTSLGNDDFQAVELSVFHF
jgi:hypothetical protein